MTSVTLPCPLNFSKHLFYGNIQNINWSSFKNTIKSIYKVTFEYYCLKNSKVRIENLVDSECFGLSVRFLQYITTPRMMLKSWWALPGLWIFSCTSKSSGNDYYKDFFLKTWGLSSFYAGIWGFSSWIELGTFELQG